MFRRKHNHRPEQGSLRQVQRGGGVGPAFSYYTSRQPDTGRTDRAEGRKEQKTGKGRHSWPAIAQVPFWLLLVLGLICAIKVLLLSTSPKVIIVGNSSITANYQRSSAVYAQAAHKLLAGSITSYSKLTVNLDGTARAMEHEFPELEHVSLAVPLVGSRPIVYVQPAVPSVVMQTSHGNFALNTAGVTLAQLSHLPAGVPVIVDQSNVVAQPGKRYVPGSTVSFVKTLSYQLAAAHVDASAYVLPAASPYEVDIRLDGRSFVVRCNLEADALTQSGVVVATLQQLGATTPGSYLDVRVPGRVYYK